MCPCVFVQDVGTWPHTYTGKPARGEMLARKQNQTAHLLPHSPPALTFEAIIQFIQLTVFCLPLPENQVVCDVAVGVRGRLPLQNNLG